MTVDIYTLWADGMSPREYLWCVKRCYRLHVEARDVGMPQAAAFFGQLVETMATAPGGSADVSDDAVLESILREVGGDSGLRDFVLAAWAGRDPASDADDEGPPVGFSEPGQEP